MPRRLLSSRQGRRYKARQRAKLNRVKAERERETKISDVMMNVQATLRSSAAGMLSWWCFPPGHRWWPAGYAGAVTDSAAPGTDPAKVGMEALGKITGLMEATGSQSDLRDGSRARGHRHSASTDRRGNNATKPRPESHDDRGASTTLPPLEQMRGMSATFPGTDVRPTPPPQQFRSRTTYKRGAWVQHGRRSMCPAVHRCVVYLRTLNVFPFPLR